MRGAIHLTPQGKRQTLGQTRTLADLERHHVHLEEDLVLTFWCEDEDELGNPDGQFFEGTVHRDPESHGWYVVIDETSYYRESDE